MLNFKNKKEVFDYIKIKFKGRLILVRGSTAFGKIRNYADIDVEIYTNNLRKPYYEIIFLNKKPVLLTVYFQKYKEGKLVKPPRNIKVLSGRFNKNIKPKFLKDKYNSKEKIKRECQLIIDFFFKYLRSKDKKYLKAVQKRL
ncbi:hypothetical protein HY498_01965 [Candidatus Woesearchaeota archaeon]|nr:hypothetical protein [Candidatus Woesearchaeota archaeon]